MSVTFHLDPSDPNNKKADIVLDVLTPSNTNDSPTPSAASSVPAVASSSSIKASGSSGTIGITTDEEDDKVVWSNEMKEEEKKKKAAADAAAGIKPAKGKGKAPAKKAEEKLGPDGKPIPKGGVSLRQLFRYADGIDKCLMFWGTLGGMVNGACMPLFSVIFGELTDSFNDPCACADTDQTCLDACNDDRLDNVSKYALWFIWLGIIAFACSWMQIAFWMITSERQSGRLRHDFFRAVLSKQVAWFDFRTPGELTTRLAGDTKLVQDATGEKVSQFAHHMTTFLTGIIIGFVRGWQLTLVIIAVTPLLAVAGGLMASIMGSATTESQEFYGKAGAVASEAITSVRTVAAFGNQEYEVSRYSALIKFAMDSGIKKNFYSGIMLGMTMLVFFGSYGLALWYGATLIGNTTNPSTGDPYTGGDMLSVFFAVLTGAMSLGQAAPSLPAIISGQGAALPLHQIIDEPSKIDSFSTKGAKPHVKGNLQFDDIHFAYPSRASEKVFNGLSLTINAGDTIALVGPSGCGKSSIISLIERFYDPDQGRVLIDGEDLRNINVNYWRQNVGLVSQEPLLFAGSLRENIAYGKPNATQVEIEEAARLANCHDFIMEKGGYDVKVGEEGKLLSGGQKQRIAIARAIIKNPQFLLLDEATSALDNENEAIVQAALSNLMKGRTTIMVAHRLSTVRFASCIYVFNKGAIIEQGTHDELVIKTDGVYQSMWNAQSQKSDDSKSEDNQAMLAAAEKKAVAAAAAKAKEEKAKTDEKKNEKDEVVTMASNVSMGRVLSLTRDDWIWTVFGLLGSLCDGAIFPFFAWIFADMTKAYFLTDESERKSQSATNGVYFFLIGVGLFLTSVAQMGFLGLVGERLTYKMRQLSFRAMLRKQIGWFDDERNASGILVTRLASDASLINALAAGRLGQIIHNITMVAVGLAIAFANGWKLTLVVCCIGPAMVFAGLLQAKFMVGFSGQGREAQEAAGQVASESISHIRTVASFTGEQALLDKFVRTLSTNRKSGISSAHIAGVGFGCSQFVMFAAYALSFWYGMVLVKQGEMTFQEVMKVFMSILMAAFGLGQTGQMAPDYQKATKAANHIFALIDEESTIDPLSTEGVTATYPHGDISMKNIHFEYPTRPGKKIYNGLSLSLPPHKTIALVGGSGSGKSTIIGLIQRFYEPSISEVDPSDATKVKWHTANRGEGGVKRVGEVTIDGFGVHNTQPQSLRSQLGVVSQEPTLFSGTIRDNFLYGKPGAFNITSDEEKKKLDEEIVRAAEMANIHKFILTLPYGYDSPVGTKGLMLSGGQKQRIAIARSLMRSPRILLLDEATSALDSTSERVVQRALESVIRTEARTTVIIAHRLSTVQNADYIVVLDNGSIVEGPSSHDTLLALPNGKYAQMWADARARGALGSTQ